MEIIISSQEMKTHHKDIFDEFIEALDKDKKTEELVKNLGDSMKIEDCIMSMEFFYSYGIRIQNPMSFDEMLREVSGRRNKEPEPEISIEQKISQTLANIVGLSIGMRIPEEYNILNDGICGMGMEEDDFEESEEESEKNLYPLNNMPKLFIEKLFAILRDDEEKMRQEKDRLSKLTPKEKDREIRETLNELYDQPGFMGIGMGPRGFRVLKPSPIFYDMDELLDKVARVGVAGLTKGEKDFMDNESKK